MNKWIIHFMSLFHQEEQTCVHIGVQWDGIFTVRKQQEWQGKTRWQEHVVNTLIYNKNRCCKLILFFFFKGRDWWVRERLLARAAMPKLGARQWATFSDLSSDELSWCHGPHGFDVSTALLFHSRESHTLSLATQFWTVNKCQSNTIAYALRCVELLGVSQAGRQGTWKTDELEGKWIVPFLTYLRGSSERGDVICVFALHPLGYSQPTYCLGQTPPQWRRLLYLPTCYGISHVPYYIVFTKENITIQWRQVMDESQKIITRLSIPEAVWTFVPQNFQTGRMRLWPRTIDEPGTWPLTRDGKSLLFSLGHFSIPCTVLLAKHWETHSILISSIRFLFSTPSRYGGKFQFSNQGLSHRINNSISHSCSLSQLYEQTQCFLCQLRGWASRHVTFRNCKELLKVIQSKGGGWAANVQSWKYISGDGFFFLMQIKQISSQNTTH